MCTEKLKPFTLVEIDVTFMQQAACLRLDGVKYVQRVAFLDLTGWDAYSRLIFYDLME
jgi:hypothetical protein